MTVVFAVMLTAGACLGVWATASLPSGVDMGPVRVVVRTSRGPYRWLNHPMYVGNFLFVCGAAGLASGWWNVLAVGSVCELLFREWIWREHR